MNYFDTDFRLSYVPIITMLAPSRENGLRIEKSITFANESDLHVMEFREKGDNIVGLYNNEEFLLKNIVYMDDNGGEKKYIQTVDVVGLDKIKKNKVNQEVTANRVSETPNYIIIRSKK